MTNFLHEMANAMLLGLMEHLHRGDIWVWSQQMNLGQVQIFSGRNNGRRCQEVYTFSQ